MRNAVAVQRRRMLLCGAAVLALAASAWAVHASAARVAEARHLLTRAHQQDAAAAEAEARAEARSKLAAAATRLVQAAQALHLDPARWAERRINLRQTDLQRSAANALLADARLDSTRLFDVEAFEISVQGAQEGLFHPPGPDSRGVQLSLQGTAFVRDEP